MLDVIISTENHLARIISQIRDESLKEELEDVLRHNSEFLHYPKTKVSLCGKFNVGKSALINAILSERVVISKPISSTGVITKIFYNATEIHRVVKRSNGQTIFSDFSSEKLSDMTVKDNFNNSNNVRDIVRVELGIPNDCLKGDIELYDTPGIEDPDETMNKLTIDHLCVSDFVIFVVDAMQLKDLGGLLMKFYYRLGKNVIFVANKMDAIDDSGKKDVMDLANVYFSDYYNPLTYNSDIFFVSAKSADSQIAKLSSYCKNHIFGNPRKIAAISRLSTLKYETQCVYDKVKSQIETDVDKNHKFVLQRDKKTLSLFLIELNQIITKIQLS